MNTVYFPIMKALTAEFSALAELKPDSADQVIPLFELPGVPNRKAYRESSTPITEFIGDTSESIGELWAGKYVMFDAYHWSPTETTEHGEHIIPYAYEALNFWGVKAVPVVGYDRWGVQEYELALQSISRKHKGKFCIRLDHTAFEDSAEPEFFQENLDEIISLLELQPSNCHVVLDFEDVTSTAVIDLMSKFESLFNLIAGYGFMSYSIAGCSLPKTINIAVKKPNTCGVVLRKEMLLWRNARQLFPNIPIYFGDYGVRGPGTNEGVRNKHTNGKIRYTIDKEYYIARGQSISMPPKGEQMWELANKIIMSGHYLGPDFSWGDSEILRCSNRKFKGNAGQWIAIDTNHHLTYVVAEVTEFERTMAARTIASEGKE